jgi:hypothetical protein
MMETDVFEGRGLAIPKAHIARKSVEILPHCIKRHHSPSEAALILLYFSPMIAIDSNFDVR